MSRYRWFNAQWPITIPQLSKKLKTRVFSDNGSTGFVIDRVREDFLEARYIERVEFVEKIEDPFGREFSVDRVEFYQCNFRASTQAIGLELINQPRNIQGLISNLIEITNFKLAVSSLSVDVVDWAENFRKLSKKSTIIDMMQIGAIILDDGIRAKTIIKGDVDVLEACSASMSGKSHQVEKLQLRFIGSASGKILLTSSGAIKIDAENEAELLICLREALSLSLG